MQTISFCKGCGMQSMLLKDGLCYNCRILKQMGKQNTFLGGSYL